MTLKSEITSKLPENYRITNKAKEWFGKRKDMPNDFILDYYSREYWKNNPIAPLGTISLDDMMPTPPSANDWNLGSYMMRPNKPTESIETEITNIGNYLIRPHKPEEPQRPNAEYESEPIVPEDFPITEVVGDYKMSEEWTPDNKLGPNNEPLPEDALGWDSNGDPFYGYRWEGYKNRLKNRIKGWREKNEEIAHIINNSSHIEASWAIFKATTGVDLTKRVFMSAIDLFQAEVEEAEKILTATEMTAEEIAQEGEAYKATRSMVEEQQTYQTEPLLSLAGMPFSPTGMPSSLPVWYTVDDMPEGTESLSALKALDPGYNITNMLLATWAAAAAIVHPNIFPGDKERYKEMWKDNMAAGSAGYTAHANESIRRAIINQSHLSKIDGELAAIRLANPWAEMTGQIAADPSNIIVGIPGKVLGKAIGLIPDIKKVARAYESVDHFQNFLVMAENIDDIAKYDEAIDVFMHSQEVYTTNMASRLNKLRKSFGWRIKSGLRIELNDTIGSLFRVVAQSNPENAAKTLEAMATLHSPDIVAAREAAQILLEHPSANILMSALGEEGGYMLYNFLKNDEGLIVSEEIANRMHKLANAHDPAKAIYDFTTKAIDKMFPDLSKFSKLEEARWYHKVSKILHMPIKGVETFRKKVATPIYLYTSFSNLSHDVINSHAIVLIENGMFGLTDYFKYNKVENRIVDMVGFLPEYLQSGQSLGVTRKVSNFKNPLVASFEVQRRMAARVADAKIYEMLNMFNDTGKILPDTKKLVKAGINDDIVRVLAAELRNNHYNLDKIPDVFEIYKTGIERRLYTSGAWIRDAVGPEDASLISGLGFWDDLTVALDAPTPEKAIINLQKLYTKVVDNTAQYAKIDVPSLKDLTNLPEGVADFINALPINKMGDAEMATLAIHTTSVQQVNAAAGNLLRTLFTEVERLNIEGWASFLQNNHSFQIINSGLGEATYASKQIKLAETFKLSDAWRELDKGTNWAELWAKTYPGVTPPYGTATKAATIDSLWSYHWAMRDNLFTGLRDTKYSLTKRLYDDVLEFLGDVPLKQSRQRFDELQRAYINAKTHSGSVFYNNLEHNLGTLVRGAIINGDKELAIRAIASRFGMSTMSGRGRINTSRIVQLVNDFTGNEYTSISKIPLEEALETFKNAYSNLGFDNIENVANLQIKHILGTTEDAISEGIKLDGPIDDIAEFVINNGTAEELASLRSEKEVLELARVIASRNPGAVTDADLTLERLMTANVLPSSGELPSIHNNMAAPESQAAYQALFSKLQQGIMDNFAELKGRTVTDDMIKAIGKYKEELSASLAKAKITASEWGRKYVNSVFPNYTKQYGPDIAASMIWTYPFWYTRQTAQWMIRAFTSNPLLASRYSTIKRHLIEARQDIPEYYRTSIDLRVIPGIDADAPIWFQADRFHPVSYLVKNAYEDPHKRATWYGAALDNLNSFGPATWVWYNVMAAIGMRHEAQEQRDNDYAIGAERIAGRLLPQTGVISNIGGLLGKDWELDPFISKWGGWGDGIDPYQRDDIARELYAMSQNGEITLEEFTDIAHKQEGKYWDLAVARARKAAAPTGLIGYFTGAGIRPQTQEQETMREFYEQMSYVMNSMELSTKDEQMAMWDDMRKQFPWMDGYLLSRKGGIERDRALAYTVLSRIPPGKYDEVAATVGLKYEHLQKFWEDGGDMREWSEDDRDTFMGGIISMSAVLSIPDDATRDEWTQVKKQYQSVVKILENRYGDDIMDRIDAYMALNDINDPVADYKAEQLLKRDPDISEALDRKASLILSVPLLSAYYGGYEKMQQYYNGEMYNKLEQEYGEDIWDKWNILYDYRNQCRAGNEPYCQLAKIYNDDHPELEAYSKSKSILVEQRDKLIAAFVEKIPEATEVPPRPGPYSSIYQQALAASMQKNVLPSFTYGQWNEYLGNDTMEAILYAARGGELDEAQYTKISSAADIFGVTPEHLILAIGEAQY